MTVRPRVFLLTVGLVLAPGCPADDGSQGTETSEPGSSTGPGTSAGPSSDTVLDGPASTGQSGTSNGATSVATTDATTTTATTDPTGPATTGPGLCGARPIVDLDSAIGIRFGDIPPVGGGGTSTTTGGGGIPDDNVSLRLSNYAISCAAPSGDGNCQPFMKWRLSFNVPVEMQQPGVYSFEDLNAGWSVQDPGAGQECGGTGGGGDPGTLIIESWGDTIVGCIEAEESIWGVDPTGSFVAERCG